MKQIQLQIAFFLSKFIERPDELFYMNLVNEYNPPTIFPAQKPLPGLIYVDAPIVQAKMKNGIFDLSISNMRLDLTKKTSMLEKNDEIIKQYYSIINNYSVNRVGIVATFFEQCGSSYQIFKKYLNVDENASEMSIRYNKKDSLNGISINNVTTIQDAEFMDGEKKQKGVFFIRDVNTDPKSRKELSEEEILKLYQYSEKQFEQFCIGD